MEQLTDQQKAILDFETENPVWKYAAAKDGVVLHRFGSPTLYYATVNHLLDNPAALAYAPATVRRLGRLREARRAVRTTPTLQ